MSPCTGPCRGDARSCPAPSACHLPEHASAPPRRQSGRVVAAVIFWLLVLAIAGLAALTGAVLS